MNSEITDKIEAFEAELAEMETNMKTWYERLKHIQEVTVDVITRIIETRVESVELDVEINKIRMEMDSISKEKTELKSSKKELDQQLQMWVDVIRDNNKKVSYWKRELKKLRL